MRNFNIYKHPTKGIQAVKIGISWPALFFGFFWMAVKNLWALTGAWIFAYIVFAILEKYVEQSLSGGSQTFINFFLSIGYFALWLVPVFKGNKWVGESLIAQGYELVNTVQSSDKQSAISEKSEEA